MRILTASIMALILCAMSAPLVLAQNEAKGNNKGDRVERKQKMLEMFDKDGNGKLNDEERAAAKKARQDRVGKKGKGKGDARKGRQGGGRRGGKDQAGRRERMSRKQALAKFDTDKDGKLSKDERAKMMAAMKKHRQEMLKKRFDKDGDGKLNADEKAAMDKFVGKMEAKRKKMVKKFDADGDGKLNKEERQKMEASRPDRDGKGGKKEKKGGKRGKKNKSDA